MKKMAGYSEVAPGDFKKTIAQEQGFAFIWRQDVEMIVCVLHDLGSLFVHCH